MPIGLTKKPVLLGRSSTRLLGNYCSRLLIRIERLLKIGNEGTFLELQNLIYSHTILGTYINLVRADTFHAITYDI